MPTPHAAHDALAACGWSLVGRADKHGLHSSDADSYSHPQLDGHRVNVAASGEWEHISAVGGRAAGAAPRQLARYLGAIHGTTSLADLMLPGRRDGDE